VKHAYAELSCGQVYYENEGKGKSAVLCLHQLPWASPEFNQVIPLLSKTLRVVAPDMIGFGTSDAPAKEWGTKTDLVNYVIQLMDALEIKKFSILGSHFGSALALEVAAAYPARVNKLVLYGCGIPAKKSDAPASGLTIEKEVPIDMSHFRNIWKYIENADMETSAHTVNSMFLAAIRAYDMQLSAKSICPKANDIDIVKAAKKVKAPALLLVGANDIIKAPAYKAADAVAELLPSCKVTNIKGAGLLGMHPHAAEIAKAANAFLKD